LAAPQWLGLCQAAWGLPDWLAGALWDNRKIHNMAAPTTVRHMQCDAHYGHVLLNTTTSVDWASRLLQVEGIIDDPPRG